MTALAQLRRRLDTLEGRLARADRSGDDSMVFNAETLEFLTESELEWAERLFDRDHPLTRVELAECLVIIERVEERRGRGMTTAEIVAQDADSLAETATKP